MSDWAKRAATKIAREFEQIEAECGQLAQIEQDPEPGERLLIERIEGIIDAEFRKCPECGGRGHRFYAGIGEAHCLACKGRGTK